MQNVKQCLTAKNLCARIVARQIEISLFRTYATKEEAYLATRQAVYCAVYGRDPNSYHALGGAAGERTLNALKQIVYNDQ